VCLVIKDMGVGSFYGGQTAEKLLAAARAQPHAPEIEYIHRELTAAEMASLYSACDCLVHPFRGEGFGLPIIEAMAHGLPAIITGYGPVLDYASEETAYLVPAREVRFAAKQVDGEETVDYPWLVEPDIDVLRSLLRQVMEQPEQAREKGERARRYILSHFTWEHTVTAVEARLHALRQRVIHRRTDCQSIPPPPDGLPIRPTRANRQRKSRVSLCMIVKNEEAHLDGCLQSVADLVDEIVIADTGSTDRTKEIAKRFGAKVMEHVWQDSFAAARNESLRHAGGDWIFWLDADERLDETNRARLAALFDRLGDENVAYLMRQHSPLDGPGHGAAAVDQVRLFRNHRELRWRHRVHEQILPSLRELGADVRPTGIVIAHAGFADPATQGPKVQRNLRLLQLELDEHPDDAFVLFNLGAVTLTQGRREEAIDLLSRSLGQCRPSDSLVPKIYALLVRAQHERGRKDEAAKVCRQARQASPADAELLFWEAILRHESGDLEGAAESLLGILNAPKGHHFMGFDAGLHGYRTRNFLAEIYAQQGKLADAETQWSAVVGECPGFTAAWKKLAELWLSQSRWMDLDKAVRHIHQNPPTAVDATLLWCRALVAQNDFANARKLLERISVNHPGRADAADLLRQVLLQEDVGAVPTAVVNARPRGTRPRVSLSMIVKNEEANLPECLASLADLVDEIVIVDTGSTDCTKEIARRFGAKVFDFAWVDSFAAARNESLAHVTGEWVLWLDADDRLDADNRARLRRLLDRLPGAHTGYVMKCLCLPDPETKTATVVDHVRLFRNQPGMRWKYRVHEQILPALRGLGGTVEWTDVVVHHVGYRNREVRRRKLERDLRLLLLEQSEQPDDPFTLFNLGSVYQEMGKLEEAIPLFRRSLAGSCPTDSIVRKLYALIAQCQNHLGRPAEAAATCLEGRTHYPDDAELLFQEGTAFRHMGDAQAAVRCWEQVLRAPPGAHFASMHTGLRGYLTRHNLAMAYLETGQYEAALEHWNQALAEQADYLPALTGLAELALKQQRWDRLTELLERLRRQSEAAVDAAVFRARMHLARQEFAPARQILETTIAAHPAAVWPRVILSHVLLQEGRDWRAAERGLRDVLTLDPSHNEARQNPEILLRQHG